MFKKKLSIKAAFSAVVASFLFCLCLGKSVCAWGNVFGGNVDVIYNGLIFQVSREDNEENCKIAFFFKNCSDSETKEVSINSLCDVYKSIINGMVAKGTTEKNFCDRFDSEVGSFYLPAGREFFKEFLISLEQPSIDE